MPAPHPKHTERKAEAAARNALRSAGCSVVNVNRAISRDYPVIDLVARKGTARILVQVRGNGCVIFSAATASTRRTGRIA